MPERAKAAAEPKRAPAQAQPVAGGMQPGPEIADQADMDQALGAGQAVATLQTASGAADPPPSYRMTAPGLLALQHTVGNRAVADAMRSVVQRVPVSVSGGETLYNQSAAGGQAGAKHYGMGGQYDMSRDGDASVTVAIKIKFIKQNRNTLPPTPPATSPNVGDRTGPITNLPIGDQAWAADIAGKAVKYWNDAGLVLVGEEWNAFKDNTKKRIPVTFKSIPIFDKDAESDQTVAVHPPGVVAQGSGNGTAIDAGNYYMKKDDSVYPAEDKIIYAHEYGHLLGIPDEYSQSNQQMNLLLHNASPTLAASSKAALDKKTIERMALSVITPHMKGQLDSTMAAVTDAIRGQRKLVKQKMSKAAREAARTPEVSAELKAVLEAQSEIAVNPKVPGAVAFETTKNFSNIDIAGQGVEAGFASAALATQIKDAYAKAIDAPMGEKVNVPGLGDVKINVKSSVSSAGLAAGTTNTQAWGVAGAQVGQTGPGLPAMPPPTTLTGQLAGAVGTWSTAGSALESGVTGPAFAAKMVAAIKAAGAAPAAPPPGVVVPPTPKIGNARDLYNKAYAMVTAAARLSSQQLATDLVGASLDPILKSSVDALQAAIAAEVTRITTMTPAQLAANPSPDPNMAAIVTGMKTRLDAAKTGLAGTGMDPLGVSGATTPAQDVTYSYQGLMGSNATGTIRVDQFAALAAAFNKKLKNMFEKDFKAEVK